MALKYGCGPPTTMAILLASAAATGAAASAIIIADMAILLNAFMWFLLPTDGGAIRLPQGRHSG